MAYQPPAVPPPGYQAKYGTDVDANANTPLLAAQEEPYASGSNAPRNEYDAMGDDIPEDFKIGMTVSQSSQDVRHAFVAKVYGVLFCQILGSTVVGAIMSTESIASWVHEHAGLMMLPMFGAVGVMLATYFYRHSHPTNILLLGLFTLLESVTIGSVVSYYNQTVVLQALVITCFVFVGLTIFTFQSKYDFENMGAYLFAALLAFCMTGLVGIFLPFGKTTDMLMAGAGVVLFSLYIVYDTHLLLRKLHVDDWVMACISLYLDLVNLFLQILRLLSDMQER